MQIKIDIIILSYAEDKNLKNLTEQTIQTLLDSEDSTKILFNVVVIESNKSLVPFQFANSKTLYPKQKFGFHTYLNIGIQATDNNYVCLCNNDLIFHKGWATELLTAMNKDPKLLSTSPYCPEFHGSRGIKSTDELNYGYINGINIAGWCIFVKRELFNSIGLLDEKFIFWCCDDDYRMTLKSKGIKHALVCSSIVEHLESRSISKIITKKRSYLTKKYTTAQQHYFDYKWHHKNRLLLYLKYLKLYLLDK